MMILLFTGPLKTGSPNNLWCKSSPGAPFSKVCFEITYPFPNFNGCTVEVWEWILIHPTFYNGFYYLSMLGFKLNHVSKRGHRYIWWSWTYLWLVGHFLLTPSAVPVSQAATTLTTVTPSWCDWATGQASVTQQLDIYVIFCDPRAR